MNLGSNIAKYNDDEDFKRYGLADEIFKLTMGLYDEVCKSEDVGKKVIANRCLDIWDEMYEKQIGSTRKLSEEIFKK